MPAKSFVTSVILVSYNSEDDLPQSIESVPASAELVVVDQSPTGSAGQVARRFRSDVVIVNSGANRGFGAGCNLGAANSSGDILLFLNPDAVFEAGAAEILGEASARRGGAVVGPSIIDDQGQPETRARNWSSPLSDVLALLVPPRYLPRRFQQDIPASDPRYRTGGAVPYVQGSCFAVGRDNFFAIGGFDEEFFLYGEEEHLSRQLLLKCGIETVLEPAARVYHAGHTSTDRVRVFAVEQLMRSRVLGYRKRSGVGTAWLGSVLHWLAICGLLTSGPVRRLVGYRSVEDSEWCRAALRGVSAGIRQRPARPPAVPVSAGAWSVSAFRRFPMSDAIISDEET